MLPDIKKLVLLLALVICYSQIWSQIETGGIPRSFSSITLLKAATAVIVPSPDLGKIQKEDEIGASLEKPYRVGVPVELKLDMTNSGTWDKTGDGGMLWRLKIICTGAKALGVDYSDFYMPAGADLFIYNEDHSKIAGAFTLINNSGGHSFSTRPVEGDKIILEYYQPLGCTEQPKIDISGLNFMYRGLDVGLVRASENFGGSGSCEVNINCSEGDQWRSQINSVVRVLARVSGQSFWCTGSLVNNTRLDFSPLLLTANHCAESSGSISTPDDLNKWIFYFNYESPNCENPGAEPVIKSMTGATKLASSENPLKMGSDFYLVRLNQNIPSSYDPFYNGWSLSEDPSVSGVGIHHPEGDIKKISTYTVPVVSATWDPPDETHWLVKWSETNNGYGVTEAGSSGSPLFNYNGLLVGTLTGGNSDCSNTSESDYYGKFSYSWQSNGSADSMQLKPWLDPVNQGFTTFNGAYNRQLPVSLFQADTTCVAVGDEVNFTSQSLYTADSLHHWYFEGGLPKESFEKDPKGIKYTSFGKYTVALKVSNQFGSDSLAQFGYINVKALVYPNPTSSDVTIFTGTKLNDDVQVEIFNQLGMKVFYKNWVNYPDPLLKLGMPTPGNVFYLRLTRGNKVQTEKVLIQRGKY